MSTNAPKNRSSGNLRKRSTRSLRREHKNAGKHVQRVMLGWDRPLLHSAIDYLVPHYTKGECWDMDHVYVVLPSSLAARRLQQLMAQTAAERNLLLRPPQILTFGDLPERLYKAKFPFASELQQLLAWIDTLKSLTADELAPLLFQPPNTEQNRPWIELASMLAGLHRELSSDLTMFSDVVDLLRDDADAQRWEVLARLQNGYLDRISAQQLWDIQTARRFAIEYNEVALPPNQEVVMLGTVDLNRAQRYFIDIIGRAVTVLIGAPESWQDGFDQYGALRSDFWQDICVEIDDDTLVSRASADEVGEDVASFVGQWSANYSAQQITIGVPESELLPTITERLQRSGIHTRLAAGIPLAQTPPLRLLKSISEFLAAGSYDAFAALIRTPAAARVLGRNSAIPVDFLTPIDRYYTQTILSSVRIAEFPEGLGSDVFRQVLAAVDEWLRPLFAERRSLQDWANPLLNVLQAAFSEVEVDLDESNGAKLFEACRLVSQSLAQFRDLPERFTIQSTLQEVIGWLERELEGERIAFLPDPASVEILGWLELSLDDAPALLLTGIHDGVVPESVNGDAFLPNQIRTRLGLLDNARRYARDCYAMQVILHARDQLRILTNHYSSDGTPQTPSRLLLAVQPDDLAKRITQILKPGANDRPQSLRKRWVPAPLQSEVPIPLPTTGSGKSLTAFSATDLADYLYCPYRFYLKKVCRLRKYNDASRELEANVFGELIHNCVAEIKGSEVEKSKDASELRKWLFARLNHDALKLFGKQPSPAVRLQIEQARMRIAAFADLQAQRVREGWTIWATEIDVKPEHNVSMDVDNVKVYFQGRIDRIDYHAEQKCYAIWDYKTSDTPKKPLKAHFASGIWKQLQLPLYLHLVKGLGIHTTPSVGYINLPKSVTQVAFETAEFTTELLEAADAKIREVVQSIRSDIFWPPNYHDVFAFDEFKSITQHDVARRWDPNLAEESARLMKRSGQAAIANSTASGPKAETSSAVLLPRRKQKSSPPKRIGLLLDDTSGPILDSWYSSKLIRASAGSGKTYQLARRVIQLLFAGEPTDSILATTFTRKAAGEILERVLTVVADAILDKAKLKQLQEMVSPRKVSLQGCKYHLSRLCSDLHRLRISTLDGFYSELARNFSLELALPPGWKLADPFEESGLRVTAINRMFAAMDHSQLHSLISQLCKGEAARGVWREIATTVDAGFTIYRATAEKAWKTEFESRSRSEAEVTVALEQLQASQCNHKSFPASRDKAVQLFLEANGAEFLKHSLIKNALEGSSIYSRKEVEPDICDAVSVLCDAIIAREFKVLQSQNAAAYDLLANYNLQLERVKLTNRTLTFDDVSQRLAAWMRRKLETDSKTVDATAVSSSSSLPETDLSSIDNRMDARIKHLLLDEFQDTSPTQWSILQPFAANVFVAGAPKADKTSIFCVGDTKQAIYGWRGGVAELFDVIARQLEGIGAEILSKSYRSSPVVIDFVNAVFTALDRHENYGSGAAAIAFWMNQFSRHETEKTALAGYVRIFNGTMKKSSAPAEETDEDELDDTLFEKCVDDISDLHKSAPEKSIAVLLRTNGEVTHVINLLREKQIDASQEGGNPLTDSAAVDLILSVISLADHPGDGISDFHVRSSPLAKHLYEEDAATSAIELSQAVRQSIDRCGYAETIASLADMLAPFCNDRDQLRLEQLIQLGYRFEGFEANRLKEFIDYVASEKVSLPRPAAVRVMTIHQAKGLEFDAVFLPNLARKFSQGQSTFIVKSEDATAVPSGVTRNVGSHLQRFLSKDWQAAFDKDAIQRLQESVCNFYVAITRARQALYIYAQPTKNPVQTWDSVLHSIFDSSDDENSIRQKEQTIVYELGDSSWAIDGAASNREPKAKSTKRKSQELFDFAEIASTEESLIDLADGFDSVSAPTELRYLPQLRPSSAEAATTVDLSHAFARSATVGSVVGTVIHRWFEDIIWLTDYKFDRDIARQQALDVLTPEQMPLFDMDEWIVKFENYLHNPSVQRILSQEPYKIDSLRKAAKRDISLEIQNERRILEYVDGMLLRGTIDRLVLVLDEGKAVAAQIIDYKTDFLDVRSDEVAVDDWIDSRVQRHGKQLRMYRDAISRQYKLAPNRIAMTLMLLSADAVVSVPSEES